MSNYYHNKKIATQERTCSQRAAANVGGTFEEQDCWFRAKRTQNWQYNILTGDHEAVYRARENEHMSNYYHNKKIATQERTCSQRAAANASAPADNLDGIDVLDVEDSSHSIAQEKSRQR